jgi:hypothetical protein
MPKTKKNRATLRDLAVRTVESAEDATSDTDKKRGKSQMDHHNVQQTFDRNMAPLLEWILGNTFC